jgi:hypothetical protein
LPKRMLPSTREKYQLIEALALQRILLAGHPSAVRRNVPAPCQQYWIGEEMQIDLSPDIPEGTGLQGRTIEARPAKTQLSTAS